MKPAEILIDSREKKPYLFKGWSKTIRQLDIGDYSLKGLQDTVAIERKSVQDMIGTLAVRRNAERFAERMWEMENTKLHLYIVVEGDPQDVVQGSRYSTINGYSLLKKLVGMASVGARLWFCGDRNGGEMVSLAILKHYWDRPGG